MQNLNERGAAYIPIAESRGITPHSDKRKWLHTVTQRCAAIFVKSKGDFYEKQVSRA